MEESEQVRARRNLLTAARRYAGTYLAQPAFTSGALEDAEKGMAEAAIAFAATQPRPKRPKKA